MRSKVSYFLLCLSVLWCLPVWADKHALLIGIDEYQNSDAITTLSAASADARALGKALQETASFPVDNVRLLTSDGQSKPTRANILYELELLSREVKPGDVVFVMYSGHGIDIGNESYLLPYDADPRSEFVLRNSALQTQVLTEALGKLPATGLILAFDMCRNNPFKGDRAMTNASLTENQARDLVLKPVGKGTQAAVTLFSCSVGERSWEWRDKKRGFFSYYLEQGLRQAGADGTVRVKDLVSYLEDAVPVAVDKNVNQKQTPWSKTEGTGALNLILAQGRAVNPLARPNQQPVQPQIEPPHPDPQPVPDVEDVQTTASVKITSNPPGAKVFLDGVDQDKQTPCEIEVDLGLERTKVVEIGFELAGYRTLARRVTLIRGGKVPLTIPLEKLPVAPKPVPKPQPSKPQQPKPQPAKGGLFGLFQGSYEGRPATLLLQQKGQNDVTGTLSGTLMLNNDEDAQPLAIQLKLQGKLRDDGSIFGSTRFEMLGTAIDGFWKATRKGNQILLEMYDTDDDGKPDFTAPDELVFSARNDDDDGVGR